MGEGGRGRSCLILVYKKYMDVFPEDFVAAKEWEKYYRGADTMGKWYSTTHVLAKISFGSE